MAPSPLASSPGALTNLQTVFEIASRYPGADNLLEQKVYRPNTQSDRRRYVEEVVLEQPIMFFASNGETCGIRCVDALSSRFAGLQGRDDSMFEQRGPSVSIRLMWPGYAPWSRQIPTRDFRSPPQPITRAKLAKNVAKTIKRFIEDMEGKPMEDDGHRQFKVGRQYISIDDLELVGLQHVSMGSWQAHVRLHRRG
ncbi:hypothetical protein BDY19DRAFT_987506 [Irpex rosettiformis]|uniref:Uncharacterized protein n=1 Tax=Irpex rosettiformis TaxID=378272 RepID=A0ACB8TR99_9APHY|nr:hypothetical protein BDY19DRAFT_987506 [Irpex rosettiformis]